MKYFEMMKDFIDGLSGLIKRAIATIKTFVESWKKPFDVTPYPEDGSNNANAE